MNCLGETPAAIQAGCIYPPGLLAAAATAIKVYFPVTHMRLVQRKAWSIHYFTRVVGGTQASDRCDHARLLALPFIARVPLYQHQGCYHLGAGAPITGRKSTFRVRINVIGFVNLVGQVCILHPNSILLCDRMFVSGRPQHYNFLS